MSTAELIESFVIGGPERGTESSGSGAAKTGLERDLRTLHATTRAHASGRRATNRAAPESHDLGARS